MQPSVIAATRYGLDQSQDVRRITLQTGAKKRENILFAVQEKEGAECAYSDSGIFIVASL